MKSVIKNFSNTLKTFLVLSLLSAGVGTYGDDTEVFYSLNVSKPNLLFVLDVSGSMNSIIGGSGSSTSFIRPIVHNDDDTHQDWYGKTILNQAQINLDSNTLARFRFTDLNIPQGVEITEAYIQFQSGGLTSGDAKFDVYSEASDNAIRYQSIFNVYVYPEKQWVPNEWVAEELTSETRVDVKQSAQYVISRGGWNAKNAMAFYIVGRLGTRKVATFEHTSLAAPELHIKYRMAKSKLDAMKESLRAVIDDAPDNIKIGMMNYGQENVRIPNPEYKRHHSVSGVAFPVTDINAKARDIIPTTADVFGLPSYPAENTTVRQYLSDVADSWNATSLTPIVDALYEAALYYRGEKIHYGQTLPTLNGAHPSTYDGNPVTTNVTVSGRDRASAPKYKTPIQSSCQENYIVLMTDGAPTYADSNGNRTEGPFARRNSITTGGPQGALASAIGSCSTAAGVGFGGNCGAELTHYLATHDNLPSPSGSFPNGQEGEQLIKTFAIGFGTGAGTATETYLKSLVTFDDGNASTNDDGYFEASTPDALAKAFKEILEAVAAPKGTLASPGYSVNVKNGLEHEKDIYIPVFDRKNSSRWSGNLKKFKIVDVGGRRLIQGSNNENATDELGNFTSNALDYWSTSPNTEPDGKAVQKGGLANKLVNPDARKIYSNLTGDTNVTLSTASNALSIANIANISNSDLGIASASTEAYRKTIVNFMRGWVNGDGTSADKKARLHMGDMLHSEPLVITYNPGTSPSNATQYIFAGTNEGYLHAFDTNTGEEKFAFIPADLLSELSEHQYLNSGTQADHKYGVDGVLTGDVERAADGTIVKVILYFGLRRGGNAFYALDVTNPDNPKLLWKRGKSSDTSSPYNSMGQSWSTPYVAKVGVNGVATAAVLVSGGYDEDEDRDRNDGSGALDDATTVVTADEGNNIYIFAAGDGTNAGELLWSMPDSMRSQITNSIPGGLRPLDTNYNGLIDRIYFADTGGNVWRLDLSEDIGRSGTTSSVLTKLAALGGTGANNLMFFNEPDVSILKLNGKNVFGIALGSGFRPHPMDKSINDKFFFLVDDSPYKPLVTSGGSTFSGITMNDLAEIKVSAGAVTQTGSITETGTRGWVIHLPEIGEKVLGTSIAFDGKIAFTTLVPEVLTSGVGIDQCAAPVTQSRFYAFNIISGEPGLDLDLDGDIDDNDAFITTGTEILGKPQIVFNPPDFTEKVDSDGNPTGEMSCSHPVDIRTGKKLSQSSNYEACRLESVYWSDPVHEQ